MAHNYKKMKQIAILLFQIGLYLFAILLFFRANVPFFASKIGVLNNPPAATEAAIKFDVLSNIISFVSFLLPLLWTIFDKWLWKKPKINRLLALTAYETPILEGRWVGKLYRGNDVRDFVLEIRQTFTQVHCKTYTPSSFSRSKIAEFIFSSEQDCVEHLFWLWEGKTTNTTDGSSSTNLFYGTTMLAINTCLQQLSGEYFTNRQPSQTHGRIELKFEQKKCYNSFDKQ